jgi:hypothetical protein
MRKLILGVSLYWPILTMLAVMGATVATMGRSHKWTALILFLTFAAFALFFERVWCPYFGRTRLGVMAGREIPNHFSSSAK